MKRIILLLLTSIFSISSKAESFFIDSNVPLDVSDITGYLIQEQVEKICKDEKIIDLSKVNLNLLKDEASGEILMGLSDSSCKLEKSTAAFEKALLKLGDGSAGNRAAMGVAGVLAKINPSREQTLIDLVPLLQSNYYWGLSETIMDIYAQNVRSIPKEVVEHIKLQTLWNHSDHYEVRHAAAVIALAADGGSSDTIKLVAAKMLSSRDTKWYVLALLEGKKPFSRIPHINQLQISDDVKTKLFEVYSSVRKDSYQ